MELVKSKILQDETTWCKIHIIHLKVDGINNIATEMIETISDTSWLNNMSTISKISFKANSEKTINKLIEIFRKVDNQVTKEFWEYLVSYSSQEVLESNFSHIKVPLAELIKEKIIWNPWFDFHTETNSALIMFWEAKFTSKWTPYINAINQIKRFINEKKDDSELNLLSNFVSQDSLDNYSNDWKKSFAASFSLDTQDIDSIFNKSVDLLNSNDLNIFPELYLIWIEIW